MSEDKCAKEWGKVKFVPKVRCKLNNSRNPANAATPWKNFKNEILEKQREEKNANAINMNSAEAQEMLKKREENYRRNLITSQANAKQPAKWEKFQEDDVRNKTQEQTTNNPFTGKPKKQLNYLGIALDNFDAKKLTFKQNNHMRRIITKGIALNRLDLKTATMQMKPTMRRQKRAAKETFKN